MGCNTHVSQTPRRTRDLSASSSLFKKLGPRVFSGLNSVPQKLSPPRTSACDLVWNKAFEMKSPWVKFGPKPKVGVLIRGKKKASFLHVSRDTEKAEAEIGVMQSQQRISRNCWELEEAWKGSSLGSPEGGRRCLHTPWFQTPGFPNCERIHFCCIKSPGP